MRRTKLIISTSVPLPSLCSNRGRRELSGRKEEKRGGRKMGKQEDRVRSYVRTETEIMQLTDISKLLYAYYASRRKLLYFS